MSGGWIEAPQSVDSAIRLVRKPPFRPRLLAFFERQLWSDPQLKRNVCWIYPSAAMIDHRAVVYYGAGPSFLINQQQLQRRAASCPASATLTVLVAKFAT